MQKASQAFENSYKKKEQDEVLERLYHLSRMDERLALSGGLKGEITEQKKKAWDQRMEKAREKAKGTEQMKQLDALFRQEPVKRLEGEAKLVYQWKQEYRNMA